MKILTIFFSSINKYGFKFLFLVFLYELLNIYRLRFSDYVVLDSVKKKYEPCVPTPYYCLSQIKKKIKKKYTLIDFGCGRGRVIDYFKKNTFFSKIIGVEINKKLEKRLLRLNSKRVKIYIKDVSDKIFLNFLLKKYSKRNLILYFYHPFAEDVFIKILKTFFSKNKMELKIVVMGEIYLRKKLIEKYKIKTEKIHKLLNIYTYKHR